MQVLDYKKWLHLSIETSWLAVGFLQIFIKHLYAWYMLLIFDIWLYLLLEMLQLCNYQIQLNHNVSAVRGGERGGGADRGLPPPDPQIYTRNLNFD